MRRPTLKGMGAKLFETDPGNASTPAQPHDGMQARRHNGEEPQNPASKYPKATFYLPVEMLERLDKAWIARRNQNRRIKKSDLVREALDLYLAAQERRRPKVTE
jgi:hypothetical protein